MDDIVIFSDTWEEHLKRLEKVLFRFSKIQSYLLRAYSRSWSHVTYMGTLSLHYLT